MLIKTAGYLWHRRHIDWTKPQLLGLPEDRKGRQVNFAKQGAIYGLYDANHQCIYIGQAGKGETSRLFDRLKSHAIEDHLFCFWERFTWFGFYSPEDVEDERFEEPVAKSVRLAEALNTIESVGIYLALPRYNLRLESGFAGVTWYYQEDEYEQAKNVRTSRRT